MAAHDVEERIEDALYAVIVAECAPVLSGVAVVKAFDAQDVAFPCVSIVVPSSKPRDMGSVNPLTNYDCTVEVAVWTDLVRTTRAEHAAIVASVREVVYADNIVTLLNDTAPGVTVLHCEPTGADRDIDQNARRTRIGAVLMVAPGT